MPPSESGKDTYYILVCVTNFMWKSEFHIKNSANIILGSLSYDVKSAAKLSDANR